MTQYLAVSTNLLAKQEESYEMTLSNANTMKSPKFVDSQQDAQAFMSRQDAAKRAVELHRIIGIKGLGLKQKVKKDGICFYIYIIKNKKPYYLEK